MFKSKKRRRRRSELRLGAQPINYETTTVRPTVSVMPVIKFWQIKGARIVGLAALVLLGWALYSVFSNPAFFIYNADVSGNVAISTREIYTASGVHAQSVFWINPAETVEKILSLPNIKSASVAVTLPARVSIEVVERRPQLLWQTGDAIWWVDEEGTIVPSKSNVENMLKIIDDDRQPMEAGLQINPQLIKGAQSLRLLAPELSVMRHTRALGLIVATPEGWPVYLGDGSQIRAKMVVLSTLLPTLREKETPPAYIDLRNPLRPVYRLLPNIPIAPPTQPPAPVPRPQPPVRN